MLTSQLTTLSITIQIQYNKKTILIKSIKHGLFLIDNKRLITYNFIR